MSQIMGELESLVGRNIEADISPCRLCCLDRIARKTCAGSADEALLKLGPPMVGVQRHTAYGLSLRRGGRREADRTGVVALPGERLVL